MNHQEPAMAIVGAVIGVWEAGINRQVVIGVRIHQAGEPDRVLLPVRSALAARGAERIHGLGFFLARRKSLTSAWRPSTSSIEKPSSSYAKAKNLRRTFRAGAVSRAAVVPAVASALPAQVWGAVSVRLMAAAAAAPLPAAAAPLPAVAVLVTAVAVLVTENINKTKRYRFAGLGRHPSNALAHARAPTLTIEVASGSARQQSVIPSTLASNVSIVSLPHAFARTATADALVSSCAPTWRSPSEESTGSHFAGRRRRLIFLNPRFQRGWFWRSSV
jgi:hypothetical protein